MEYVELLINSVEKCIAVRPCSPENPNAIKWGYLKNNRWVVSPKSCSGFAGPLYSIMSWQSDCGYRLYGQYIQDGNKQALFFDLSDPEITRYEQIKEAVDTEKGEQGEHPQEVLITEHKVLVVPDSFGRECGSNEGNLVVFKEKEYKDGWMIMQPTRVFRRCGNLSEETIHQLRVETKEL